MSIMGVVVAMLLLTGVIIWVRKRAARVRHERVECSANSDLNNTILSQPDTA